MTKLASTRPRLRQAVDKNELRRMKNRASAERSRKSKDDAIECLQAKIRDFHQRIGALRSQQFALHHVVSEQFAAHGCSWQSPGTQSLLPLIASPPILEPAMGDDGILRLSRRDGTTGDCQSQQQQQQSAPLVIRSSPAVDVNDSTEEDVSFLSAEEALRHRQRLRRRNRIEVLKRKRGVCSSGSSISCSSYNSSSSTSSTPACALASTDGEVDLVEIPSNLAPHEIRKMKNRLSAERSRIRKLRLIDDLTAEAQSLSALHCDLLSKIVCLKEQQQQLQQSIAVQRPQLQRLHSELSTIENPDVPAEVCCSLDDCSSCSSLSLSTPPSPILHGVSAPLLPLLFDNDHMDSTLLHNSMSYGPSSAATMPPLLSLPVAADVNQCNSSSGGDVALDAAMDWEMDELLQLSNFECSALDDFDTSDFSDIMDDWDSLF